MKPTKGRWPRRSRASLPPQNKINPTPEIATSGVFEFSVAAQDSGMRLDACAGKRVPACSRSLAAHLIRRGCVSVDEFQRKPGYKVKFREVVRVELPVPRPLVLEAQPMDLDLLYEDECLIVVNKPSGLVVHPAAGHLSGTLVNGLLYHCPDLEGVGEERRPGIVHRLDKETSGVIAVAKTAAAHHELSRQFKARTIRKQYLALVHGVPDQEKGKIDLPVGRHPVDRKRMSTVSRSGREALTLWRIQAKYNASALLKIDLKTGRTHQIRVHCQSMGHPLAGDKIYGAARHLSRLARNLPHVHQILSQATRQMLHAACLRLGHPISGRQLTFSSPLPRDMDSILQQLSALVP